MNDSILREHLAALLEKGEAHINARRALAGIDPKSLCARPAEGLHSIWEEFEHMRIAQQDILRYTLDPEWKSPPWPEGYWPVPASTVTEAMWTNSVEAFFSDLEEVIALARRPDIELTARIPHGGDHTYLREILLVADHNAYHLGQIVQTRKALGDWKG